MIAGYEKLSMVDWDRMCTVIYTQGCNWNCIYCHNPELIPVEKSKTFVPEIDKWIDGIVITGGEPTIHEGLVDYIKDIKRKTGLPVKLNTNGSNPDMLKELVKIVDFIAMDIKSSYCMYESITRTPISISDIQDSVKIIKDIPHEFRMTTYEQLATRELADKFEINYSIKIKTVPFRRRDER